MIWKRVGGWISRGFLVLFILGVIQSWLDVFVFQPEEYERLIGSESACGVASAYCSWKAYVLDNLPFVILAVLAFVALVGRTLPRREQVLAGLGITICAYLAWRVCRFALVAG